MRTFPTERWSAWPVLLAIVLYALSATFNCADCSVPNLLGVPVCSLVVQSAFPIYTLRCPTVVQRLLWFEGSTVPKRWRKQLRFCEKSTLGRRAGLRSTRNQKALSAYIRNKKWSRNPTKLKLPFLAERDIVVPSAQIWRRLLWCELKTEVGTPTELPCQ